MIWIIVPIDPFSPGRVVAAAVPVVHHRRVVIIGQLVVGDLATLRVTPGELIVRDLVASSVRCPSGRAKRSNRCVLSSTSSSVLAGQVGVTGAGGEPVAEATTRCRPPLAGPQIALAMIRHGVVSGTRW